MKRDLISISPAQATSDGAGVALQRALGTRAVPMVDPFLMLDEFRSDTPGDYLKGFPDHPHRGFETVTYMLAGAMHHRDSVGNSGHLRAGSVQWMTAGRGIIHSEMPEQEEGLMWGFQLWVNLPAAQKLSPARYQDIAPEDVPQVVAPGVEIRVIAGTVTHAGADITGPIRGIITAPEMLDVKLDPGVSWARPIAADRQGFLYVFVGELDTSSSQTPPRHVPTQHLAVLGDGDELTVTAGDQGARFLLLSGLPCREPVARYGPFVMNTETEIRQAIRDYQTGQLTG